jgi:hypothetical protein
MKKDKFLITKEWLQEQNACQLGIDWFVSHSFKTVNTVVKGLIKDKKFEWADWLLTHLFSHKQNVLFACFSAKLSLKYFEKQYPNDKRPRLAIEAAIKWSKYPTKENQSAAWSAAESAAWSDQFKWEAATLLELLSNAPQEA